MPELGAGWKRGACAPQKMKCSLVQPASIAGLLPVGLPVHCRRVRLALRLVALVIGCSGLILWLVGGLHMGWSKSTETRTEIDEVTGLEYPVTENKYVLGVELLGATLAVSGGLFGLSLAFRKPARPDKQPGAGTSLTQL